MQACEKRRRASAAAGAATATISGGGGAASRGGAVSRAGSAELEAPEVAAKDEAYAVAAVVSYW